MCTALIYKGGIQLQPIPSSFVIVASSTSTDPGRRPRPISFQGVCLLSGHAAFYRQGDERDVGPPAEEVASNADPREDYEEACAQGRTWTGSHECAAVFERRHAPARQAGDAWAQAHVLQEACSENGQGEERAFEEGFQPARGALGGYPPARACPQGHSHYFHSLAMYMCYNT